MTVFPAPSLVPPWNRRGPGLVPRGFSMWLAATRLSVRRIAEHPSPSRVESGLDALPVQQSAPRLREARPVRQRWGFLFRIFLPRLRVKRHEWISSGLIIFVLIALSTLVAQSRRNCEVPGSSFVPCIWGKPLKPQTQAECEKVDRHWDSVAENCSKPRARNTRSYRGL